MITLPALLLLFWQPAAPEPFAFTLDDAHVLVKNTPKLSGLSDKCVRLSDSAWSDSVFLIMAMDECMRTPGSPLIAPFYVDLRTGSVSMNLSNNPPIETERLNRTRVMLLQQKGQSKPPGKAIK